MKAARPDAETDGRPAASDQISGTILYRLMFWGIVLAMLFVAFYLVESILGYGGLPPLPPSLRHR